MKVTRCCDTCKLWKREAAPPYCGWEEPKLPFWANIIDVDHGMFTEAEDGKRCQIWAAAKP